MLARKIRLASVGLFTAVALVSGSCGKKNSNNDDKNDGATQIVVSGQLALSTATSLVAASSPDTVYALPASVIENIYSFQKDVIKTYAIGADGRFSASVDSSRGDMLFVAVDSKVANRLDGIRGVLSVKDDSGSLLRIPAKEAKQAVDLGTLSADASGKEYVSGKKTDDVQSNFSLDLAKMKELARTDDSSRQLINVVANIKSSGDYFFAKPYMVFKAKTSKIKNVSSQVADISYNGYGLYFIGKWAGVMPENFCNGANATKKIKLTPPAGVKPATCRDNACNTKDEYSVLTNAETGALKTESSSRSSCGSPFGSTDGGFYIAKEDRGGDTSYLGFNWGGGGYIGKMPAGVWVLSLDEAEVGRYDLKTADPLNDAGQIVVYVPHVKANLDANNKVTKIDVEWSLWNAATSAYEKVTDMSSFARNVTNAGIEIADYSGGCQSQNQFTPFSSLNTVPLSVDYTARGAIFPSADGTTPGTSSTCDAEAIAVSYDLNGVTYRFDFRPYN